MIRSLTVRRLVLVALAVMVLAPGLGSAQQTELPPELVALAERGVTVDLIAGTALPATESVLSLTLERLVPAPVPEQIVAALGPEVWFVETGTLVLTDEAGASRTYQAGEQAVIPDAANYTYRIEGSDCPSVLRLAVTTVFAMQVGSEAAGPALGATEAACPAPGILLQSGNEIVFPTGPSFAFVARMTFPVEEFPTERVFSGPVGYAPEAGYLGIKVAASTNLILAAGSSVVVNGNEPHSIGGLAGAPATALVAGLVAAGETVAVTATPAANYVSPTFGYTLNWDDTWSVVAQSSADGSDLLQLSNGVSDVYFQSYGNYTGDPAACVASIAEQLPNNPGWSNVEPMSTAGGDPIAGSDADRAYTVYTFSYTADSSTTDYVEYLECRAIVPGQSVLVITQIAARDAYSGQIEPMRVLLTGLTIP